MKPGRELDALVAEKVMGWDSDLIKMRAFRGIPLPAYSTDIASAWEVVEKLPLGFSLHAPGTVFDRYQDADRAPDDQWLAMAWSEHDYAEATAATAPHAICLAALKAVGVEI